MIDFDHNATTPLHPAVRAALAELLDRESTPGGLGNPSSIHRAGQHAREVVENARRSLADCVGAQPLGTTFTSGGTEADALAIVGTSDARADAGQPAGLLTSPLEHPAVLGAAARVRSRGREVAWLQPDPKGRIAPSAVAEGLAAAPGVGIVSLAAQNHELGNRYDVAAVAEAVRAVRDDVVVHVDAVQALGKTPVDLSAWGVDLVSISAHKIGGPAGIGALLHDPHAKLKPLWEGGAQERGRRPGTESAWLAHGLAVAARHALEERAEVVARWDALRTRLRAGIEALGGRVHGEPVSNTVNVAWEGCDGQLVVMALDLAGFAASTGAACSAGTSEPSAVLVALGYPRAMAAQAVRFSMGRTSTADDVDALLDALPPILSRIREHGAAMRNWEAS